MMESINTFYNKLPKTDRSVYEVEIRYNENSLSAMTIFELIRMGVSKYDAKLCEFIDVLVYTDDSKFGTRTFVENGASGQSVKFNKKTIMKYKTQNLIGKYSLNVCSEVVVDEIEIPSDMNLILLKRRYQYIIPLFSDWRIDISIVRSTEPSTMCLKIAFNDFFKGIKSLDDLILKINSRPHLYKFQLEIEYIGKKDLHSKEIEEVALCPFRILDPEIENNIQFQQEIIYISDIIYKTSDVIPQRKAVKPIHLKYIIPQVRTLIKQQYFEMYPPTKYLLKEKTDGVRSIITIHDQSFFIISEPSYIEKIDVPKIHKTIILDTEKVGNNILVFDVIIFNDEKIKDLGLSSRIPYINKSCLLLSKHITKYTFIPTTYYTLVNTMRYKNQMEDKFKNSQFPIDGLILSRNDQSYKDMISYKWKPLEKQTFDLLCKRCPEHLIKKGNYPVKEEYVLYFLYATISRTLMHNLRLIPNYGYDELFSILPEYKNVPTPFITPFVPQSYLYYHPINEVDINNKICEFTCESNCINHNKLSNKFFVNWKYIKFREDRKVIEGITYGNNYVTAFHTFLNHINVFDISYLYNGMPTDQYYQNNGGELNVYTAVRHTNNYIKSQLINEYSHKARSVLDIGSGRGGDLYKYVQQNLVKNLVVVDKDKTSLSELFTRWLELSKSSRTVLSTSIRGIILDINDDYRSNFDKIRSITETTYFNCIFCHSTLHYFCESIETIRNFVMFCAKLSTSGTKIVITCPNGDLIYKLLVNTNVWTIVEEDTIKYQINKLYTDHVMTEAGQKISLLLPFSKGKTYEEYLVNVKVLIAIFKEYGFSLILKKPFTNYLEGFNIYRQNKYTQLTDNDKMWLSLYISLIFKFT